MGIRYHFNTKYFIINSKITALCNRNRSAVLAYIYIHTHTSSCWRESDDAGHTHIHTLMPTLNLTCARTHTHIWCAHLQPFQECFDNTHTHTHTSSCLLEIWLMMMHTYTHLYPRFIDCTDTYFSFMFTGAFPMHACGVTCNLRTYFTSMWRVFLVQMVV